MARSPKRRGRKAKTRVISKHLAPILFTAERSGATLGAAESTQATEVADALRPTVATDAMPVTTDAAHCYPPCARSLGLSHIALNQSTGQRIQCPYHIQTVGNWQSRFKRSLLRFRGVATK